MKNAIKILSLLMAALLLLPACSGAATEPAPEALPELSKEELGEIITQINNHYDETSKTKNPFIEKMLTDDILDEWLSEFNHVMCYQDLTAIDTNGIYHSAEIVKELQKGMFANEVREILGNPHFNALGIGISRAYACERTTYDSFAMYVLNDGRILLIRYAPVFQAHFKREELRERIPNFEKYDSLSKILGSGYWLQIDEWAVVSLDDFLSMTFDDEYLETAEKNLPAMVDEDVLEQIKIGMTYAQVEALTGTWGRDVSCSNEVYLYYWTSVRADGKGKAKSVYFSSPDDGEMVVVESKLFFAPYF